MTKNTFYFLLIAAILLTSCSADENAPSGIDVISATVNGAAFSANLSGVPASSTIEIVFSRTIDPDKLESQLTIDSHGGSVSYNMTYLNAVTKIRIELELDYLTEYTVSIGDGAIGVKNETLTEGFSHSFVTAQDDVIRSMAPCTSVSVACQYDLEIQGSESKGTVSYYSSHPIFEENAEWEDLTTAIIVVHGLSNNANDYFSYLTTTLDEKNLADETILISPHFTESASEDKFYWTSDNWRTGKNSTGSNVISSFDAMDAIVMQLMDVDRFPVLDKIVVTGHSSGALFTHVYAGSNQVDNSTNVDMEYVVANSQFFYYPDSKRLNEDTKTLYEPSDCAGYDFWPYGFSSAPPYLNNTDLTGYNTRFISRKIIYLIGNGTQPDGSLNTSDCANVLLGSSRFKRGDNMYEYLELTYPDSHEHERIVVQGIGHNGQGMYQSPEFKTWLDGHFE